MIYIGDGLTDIPCITMLKKQGWKSIGLYTDSTKEKVTQFLLDERINFACRAIYSYNSKLDNIVKLIIQTIALNNKLEKEHIKHLNESKKEHK